MYRGPSKADYRRAPLNRGAYGPPPVSGPPFSDPFPRPCFPPPYRGLLSYPTPISEPPPVLHQFRGPAPEGFSSREPYYEVPPPSQFQHSQPPQGWTAQQTDLQSLEVRKKAEEFLRILEAQDQLELSGQCGEKARRSNQDEETGSHSSEKHSSNRSKSRARSRARSKSRHRSRSRSRGRSRNRSHSRGRSRAKSRGKSRARSRSRSHGKSRTRAKSRARSRSHSHGKTVTRSKSQPRLDSKDSQWTSGDPSSSNRVSPPDTAAPDLFQGLKQILQSKELEKHLSVVKGALLRNQDLDETRIMQGSYPVTEDFHKLPNVSQMFYETETQTGFHQGGLLPHERVGEGAGSFPRILSWEGPSLQVEVKPVFQSIEDEEEFLYGEEEERTKPQAVTVPLAQTKLSQSPVDIRVSSAESPYLNKSFRTQTSGLLEPKVQTVPSQQPLTTDTTKVSTEDYEKVKNLLKTIGLNPGMTDISKIVARLKQKQMEQRGTSPAAGLTLIKPALEALQALSKAHKPDDSRSNRSGSSHSHRDDNKEKRRDEKERREKQIQMKRKEYLVKELEGLLKQEGSGDLIPVIGFFCQRCEEFFGDLNSAESHSSCHKSNNTQKKSTLDHESHKETKKYGEHQQRSHSSDHREREGERERLPIQDKRSAASRIYQDFRERSPERKRTRDEKSPHSSSSHGTDHDKHKKDEKKESADKEKEAGSPKSQKKKKKEKKKQKKEKKEKKKKKKEKKDAVE
ncbi:uncharacterized protein si:ch211-195b21.5 [Hoplias malabaricus]|uniref:uncharacterized protein si:ch211-195b21.5 n=1 Tax=Hoplias malabaricus TaxID=27720 RepID=UPI003461894A